MLEENLVELKVPVSGDYVSVVRLLISGVATRLGLPLEEVENLKLVVGEAFLTIVEKCEKAEGLIKLKWQQDTKHVSVSLSDPSGMHQSVTSAASLALLKSLGGEYNSTVVDGVEHLDLDFQIKYKDDRPYILYEREAVQA
ncbi:hypothetical protein IIA79_05935 [bacterium]|nr:hypothetical protein [bacterium]